MSNSTLYKLVMQPTSLFIRKDAFAPISNGYIYIGLPDTDPLDTSSQIPVFAVQEDDTLVPAAQPIRINASGYPVLQGNPCNFVTNSPFSMAILDQHGVSQWYWSNVAVDDASSLTSALADPALGDALLAVMQPFTGAVVRTQHSKNADSVSVKDFGAYGDGVTDDTFAFRSAAAYLDSTPSAALLIPPGAYVISDTVISRPFLMVAEGTPRIIAKNMAGKAVFDMTSPSTDIGRKIGSVGIEWVIDGADIDCLILGPKDSAQYDTYFLRYIIRDNYCHGATRNSAGYSFAWTTSAARWFRVGDCVGAQISHNCIQGKFDLKLDPDSQPEEFGFEFDADGAVMSVRMHDNNIGPIKKGLNILNRVFITAHDNDIIGSLDGIVWNGVTKFNEPKIHHNNINAQRNGIVVNGAGYLTFTDNTIRRHSAGWKGGSSDWYGYRITGGVDIKILHSTVQPDESAGAFPGTMYGYALTNTANSILDGNFVGVGCDQGITQVNCTGVNINNTMSTQSASDAILFRFTSNSRNCSVGQYSLVSSFTGTVLSKDETIVNAISMLNAQYDLQSTANVVTEKTRVNAAADNKKWRETVGTTQLNHSIVSDNGTAVPYLILTRNGAASLSVYEVRADRVRINNGPEIITGTGSPEGVVTASKASQFWRTDSGDSTALYVKQTANGNTGWVAK